jgi:hypothetical protein
MARIRILGTVDPNPAPPDLGELSSHGASAKNVKAVAVGVGARRGGEQLEELGNLAPDTIVEITFDTGARFYHRYDQLQADLQATRSRGGAADAETVELPLALPGPITRGATAGAVIESVRTFDLDLAALGDIAGGLAGKPLAQMFDSWHRENYGLRRWALDTGKLEAHPVAAGDVADGPLLLFIHGTASSTLGGFGAIPGPAASSRAGILKKLQDKYARVLAFEHPTLSVSPIENAIDLVNALPAGARLHLVSHSRGGMIAELLCWPDRTDGKPLFADEIEQLRQGAGAAPVDYREQLAKLEDFGRLLHEKHPVVERNLRVACPAAGTTLASGRLDRWLSLATSALDLSGLGASQVYQFLKGFLLAVVKTRTDPQSVPGLEAMMPRSLLTMLLNRPGVQTTADLSVIAGDIEGGSVLARLGLQAVNWFYGGDHDLVVDTISMYGGLARANQAGRFFFDKGDSVSHFNYFRNDNTFGKMVDGLLRSGNEDAGFRRIDQTKDVSDFLSRPRAPGPRPVLFVVPDCMGSHLTVGGKRIWLDRAELAKGGFDRLRVEFRATVAPGAPVAEAYRGFFEHFTAAHEVVSSSYDWRLSVADNGRSFASALRNKMAANASEPVRIVAHGAGGLVVLAGLAADKELAAQFSARAGARILMLDLPLQGLVRIARLLLGLDRLSRHLALLAMKADDAEIVAALRQFPGLLDLLPAELFDAAAWGPGRAPDTDLLKQARGRRAAIVESDFLKLPLVQVNGTPALSMRMTIENGNIRFFADPAPALTSATAAVPGRTWWAEAEPGALAAFEPAYDAYADLLAAGTTVRLPQQPPAFATAPTEAIEVPPDLPSVFPDQQELAVAALGYVRRPVAAFERKTRLRLVHGNLAFARWPVAVGHYEGDTLAGSEAHLDRALNGRLSRRRDIRVYPGPIGSAETVLDPSQSPKGAVIVGLGPVGSLTPGDLIRTLSRALRRYALAVRESRMMPAGEMAISTLLIGTGEGGIKTADALAALLEAFKYANAMLGNDAFTEVEIIELYRDRAIEAAHALARLECGKPGAYVEFPFDGLVQSKEGGRRQSPRLEDPTWWRRLKVEAHRNGELLFSDLTDRARLPQRPVASQYKVSEFVNRAVTERATSKDYSASGTLYELLLPADFKLEARDDRHRVLVLDSVTASYPWELLRRPNRADEKPLSVRAGMVRQLAEPDTPARPVVTTGTEVLVVGDPQTGLAGFPPLPGARAEAELVYDVLQKHGFAVSKPAESREGANTLPAILCGRWRIMHLAGHGAVNFQRDGRRFTGMAIENGQFFEPADVAQMEAIPELVFLNCCYLGVADPSAERRATARFHELAANIATAFIKLGARAVIAAGWAVDDRAARRFAEVFYQQLLQGATFGEATLQARRAVYQEFANTNTWGAYQCYGDPAYRLFLDGARAETPREQAAYVHVEEMIAAARDIAQDALTLAIRDPAPLRERLRAIAANPQAARWNNDPELQATLGEAYAALGMIDEAIAAYTLAVDAEKARAPIRVIEQLANLRARRAAKDEEMKGAAAKAEIRKAITLLQGLPKLDERGPTSERWSLLGSCQKRLAQVTTGDERITALKKMRECYRKAFDRRANSGTFDSYSLLNRLLAETLLALLGAPPHDMRREERATPEEWLRRAENESRTIDDQDPSFWNAVPLADIAVGRALLAGHLDGDVQQQVVAAYLKAWRRGGSALQFASVLEGIDFVIRILSDESKGADSPLAPLCAGLRAVAAQLRSATGVA